MKKLNKIAEKLKGLVTGENPVTNFSKKTKPEVKRKIQSFDAKVNSWWLGYDWDLDWSGYRNRDEFGKSYTRYPNHRKWNPIPPPILDYQEPIAA